MEKHKLLIVEDDPNLGQILKEYLEMKGYDAHLCKDGQAGMDAFKNGSYDFCILDVMMPKKDGFTLAREIRDMDTETPVIFLTAKSLKEDTIEGLKLGADDYITKPFSMEELLLRMKAIMRRANNSNNAQGPAKEVSAFDFGGFHFDYNQQLLTHISQEPKKLTAKEAGLLRLLCLHINSTLERSAALKEIWGDDSYFNARSMDVYVTKLRKLLKADEHVQIITVHGQGFRLVTLGQ